MKRNFENTDDKGNTELIYQWKRVNTSIFISQLTLERENKILSKEYGLWHQVKLV